MVRIIKLLTVKNGKNLERCISIDMSDENIMKIQDKIINHMGQFADRLSLRNLENKGVRVGVGVGGWGGELRGRLWEAMPTASLWCNVVVDHDVMTLINWNICGLHDDVIKWYHFPRYCPSVRGIHWSPVDSPHKGQWRGAVIFSLMCARRLSKQSRCRWLETQCCSSWRQRNGD